MRNLKKICAVMMVATLALAGCSVGPKTAPTEKASETAVAGTEEKEIKVEHVGVIFPTLANEFLSSVANDLKAQLEEKGCKVELVSSDNDSAKELQQLETFASMGVDTVVVFPIGATAGEVGTSLQKLRDQGIRVVVMGNMVSPGTFDVMSRIPQSTVGETTADLAAEWIEKTFPDAADGSIEVALIETTMSPDAKECSDALRKIEELNPKAKIVETYDHPFTEPITKVQDSLEIMLTNHPDIKVVLTYSEDQALAADEMLMGKNEIDKAAMGVFTNGISQASGDKLKASLENNSVLRGSVYYGATSDIVDAIFGTVEVDEDNMAYGAVSPITPENVDEFMN